MFRNVWSVLCKESIINQDDNNISLQGVIEEISIQIQNSMPKRIVLPIEYEMVSLWIVDQKYDGKFEFKVVLLDPKSQKIGESHQVVQNKHISPNLRTRFKVNGLPLTTAGLYEFVISAKTNESKDYEEFGRVPLRVHLLKSNVSTAP